MRAMTALELGMAYAWMKRDQNRYEGATKFWNNAAEGIQECFEDAVAPGDPSVHAAAGVGAWPRITGAFASRLGPAPVGFAMLKVRPCTKCSTHHRTACTSIIEG